MAIQSRNFLSYRWLLRHCNQSSPDDQEKGFTLIELLVAMIVGSLIIGSLLYLVVELLASNRREEVLTQTQQDMRRAIDYVTRDLSEAVFVYADPATIASELDIRPDDEPILAFWRLDPVDTSGLPNDCSSYPVPTSTNNQRAECNTLKIRQSAYTLVVYFASDNSDDEIWEGPSKIVRYELPKYRAASLSGSPPSLAQVGGYRDPTLGDTSFENWTVGPGALGGNIATLTDFVDANIAGDVECPEDQGYIATNTSTDNFFACINTGVIIDPDEEEDSEEVFRENRSVRVFLRGNATNNNAGFVTFSNYGRLPVLESEVLIRGVVQKLPDS